MQGLAQNVAGMRLSLRTRIFWSFMLVVLMGLGVPAYFARETMRRDIEDETMRVAQRDASILAMLVTAGANKRAITNENAIKSLFDAFASERHVRVTYVDAYGRVLVETGFNRDEMDNHADRTEIVQALATGQGQAIRASSTLGREYVYAATALDGVPGVLPAGVVRVAMAYSGVEERVLVLMREWWWVIIGAAVVSMGLSYALSSRIEQSLRAMIQVVENVARESADQRGRVIAPEPEFASLAAAVNDMADRIDDDIRTIAQQKMQLHTILDTMQEGVLVVSAEGRIKLVNKALVRLFPYVAEGRVAREVISNPALLEALDPGVEKPSDWVEVSTLQVSSTPSQVLSVQLVRPRLPVHDISSVAVFHDISELVRLLNMRRDFMANVSHELRTPLTVIQGAAETLLELPPEDEINRDRFLATIMRHATHMTHMVEDLLHLARIESGSLPMQLEAVDASTLVHSVMLHVLGNPNGLGPRDIRVECHLPGPEDGGLSIRADAHFLSQVFRNLLENAIRHTPDKGHIVISGVRWATRQGADGVFAVSDNGPGFPPEDLQRVFERFYRVEKHRANTPGTPSTGLGLAICKHIVDRHNGRIWAENSPGGTVRFTIPLAV